MLMTTFEVSQRKACRVTGQARSTQRYELEEVDDFEKRLTKRILDLKSRNEYRRTGCRKIAQILQNEGWHVNRKRVHRLWKELGLQVPVQQKKRRRGDGCSFKNACDQLKPEYPNHVWSYDLKHDVTERGEHVKFLVIIDEFTRRCLEIRVGKSCKASDVVATLGKLFVREGLPAFIRSDNGPEFVAKEVSDFLKILPTETAFIEPGSPWQNGYCESFVGQLSNELIDGTIFRHLLEAKVLAEDYRNFYNTERLHGALDYQTPDQYYQAWVQDYSNDRESLISTGS